MAFKITAPGALGAVNGANAIADGSPSVASVAGGGWATAWLADGVVKLKVLAPTGAAVTADLTVSNPAFIVEGGEVQVTRLSTGGFVVTWADKSAGNPDDDIY